MRIIIDVHEKGMAQRQAEGATMRTKPMFENHRWSGWPGAYCHYCGAEDPVELQLAGIGNGAQTVCPASHERKMSVDQQMNPGE